MNFDDILIRLGEFGRYQKILYFLAVCLPGISCGVFMVISVFLMGVPEHRCAIPQLENDTFAIQGDYHKKLIDQYIPNADPDDSTLKYDRCQYYVYDSAAVQGNASRHIEKCSKWVYSEDIYKSTFAKQIDLVCDDRYKTSLAKSLFFVGVLLGALGLGILSDAIGRKKTLSLSVVAMMASSIGLAWAPNYIVFVLIRICVGASTSGVFMTGFVIGMELVGPSKRLFAGVINEVFFAVGLVLLAGVAYAFRDWFWIELSLSIPTVVFMAFWCILPESPRWLLSKGRRQEAEEVLRKAARVNKVTLPEKLFDEDYLDKKPETAALWNLFTSRVLLIRTLIIFFNWMVVSMTYYGLSLNTGNLGGDFYVNFLISGVVEFPAYTLCLLLLDRWGRKKCHCSAMLLGGIACLCTIFTISFGGEDLQWLTTTLAMIGKLGSAAAFAVIYVFSAELYPTVVRNAGMGASSCCARIGGILAPYVADSGVLIGGQYGQAVPLVIFGGASVLAGLLSLKLPETLDEGLPESIDDGVAFGTPEYRKRSKLSLTIDPPSASIGLTKL